MTFLKWNDGENDHYEQFDVTTSKSYSSSSSVTTFPTSKGEEISDHMFSKPLTYSLAGTFSNISKNSKTETSKYRLKDKELLFKKLKKEGILCSIITVNNEEDIYEKKENLLITNLNVTPGLDESTLGLSLSFAELIFAEIDETIVEYNIKEKNMPAVVDPYSLNVTETILKLDELLSTLVQLNYNDDLVDTEFLKQFGSYIDNLKTFDSTKLAQKIAKYAVAVKVSAVSLVAIAAIGFGIAAAFGSTGFGAILGIAVAAVTAIIIGCVKLWKFITDANKFKMKKFRTKKNAKDQEQENDRYLSYLYETYASFEQLSSKVRVYSLPSNDNCSIFLTINNIEYELNFKHNDVGEGIHLTIIKTSDESTIFSSPVEPKDSYADLSNADNVFSSVPGQYVYLIKADPDKGSDDISNIYIFCPGQSILDFNQLIINILKASFLR